MRIRRLSLTTLAALGLLACSDPAASGAGSAGPVAFGSAAPPVALSTNPAANASAPTARKTLPKPKRQEDPIAQKNHHAERCLIGLVALQAGTSAYEASLGKAKPSAGKLPSFGLAELVDEPGTDPATGGAQNEKVQQKNPGGIFLRLARTCNIAAAQTTPEDKPLDEALQEAAAFAPELGRLLTEAANYYAGSQQDKDGFKKGQELHLAILKEISKIKPTRGKLESALSQFKSKTPMKWESQPAMITQTLVDAALAALVAGKASDLEPPVATLEKSGKELEATASSLPQDNFAKMVPAAVTKLLIATKKREGDKIPHLAIAMAVSHVCEVRYAAYLRELSGRVEPPGGMDSFHGAHGN